MGEIIMTKAEQKFQRLSKRIFNSENKPLSGKDIGEMLLLVVALRLQETRTLKYAAVDRRITSLDILDLVDKLSEDQMSIYDTYARLHNAVIRGGREGTLITSQFYHAFYKLNGYQKEIVSCEERSKNAENRPMIITRSAYDALVKKALSAREKEGTPDTSPVSPKELAALFDENDPKQCVLKAQILNGGISVTDMSTAPEKGFTDGIYTADLDSNDPYDIDRFSDPNIDYFGDVRYQIRCMYEALCQIYLYNEYLKAVFEGLKIDYMDEAYINTELIEIAADQYNEYCRRVCDNVTGTAEEKEQRKAVLKEAFTPVDAAGIKEFATNTDKLKELFDKVNKLGRIDDYYEEANKVMLKMVRSLEKEAFG